MKTKQVLTQDELEDLVDLSEHHGMNALGKYIQVQKHNLAEQSLRLTGDNVQYMLAEMRGVARGMLQILEYISDGAEKDLKARRKKRK